MNAKKMSVRSLTDIQYDLDFARYEREKAKSEILHALREGKNIPVSLERECANLDKEIATLQDELESQEG